MTGANLVVGRRNSQVGANADIAAWGPWPRRAPSSPVTTTISATRDGGRELGGAWLHERRVQGTDPISRRPLSYSIFLRQARAGGASGGRAKCSIEAVTMENRGSNLVKRQRIVGEAWSFGIRSLPDRNGGTGILCIERFNIEHLPCMYALQSDLRHLIKTRRKISSYSGSLHSK